MGNVTNGCSEDSVTFYTNALRFSLLLGIHIIQFLVVNTGKSRQFERQEVEL